MEMSVAAAATCTARILQPVSRRHGLLFWIR